jgi:lysophospholipase L1-like esterase
MDIYCFGDSITYGECDTEKGGWVERLKIERMVPDMNVFNLGIGGETTRMMRARMKSELTTRLDPAAKSLVLLAYGANDAADIGGSCLIPLEEYLENLSWAIDEVRALRCEAWLLNVTPMTASADGARNPVSGRFRSNEIVSEYNDALRALSQLKSVELIDVNGALRKYDLPTVFAADGVHPNAKGHAVIYEHVRERLG